MVVLLAVPLCATTSRFLYLAVDLDVLGVKFFFGGGGGAKAPAVVTVCNGFAVAVVVAIIAAEGVLSFGPGEKPNIGSSFSVGGGD